MPLPPFSSASRRHIDPEEVRRNFSKLAKTAREYAELEARFDYSEIQKKAHRIKFADKRAQFIQNSIEEVEIKLAEDKLFVEQCDEVNDLEGAHKYLETLALTSRKLRALLEREKLSVPGVTENSQSIENGPSAHTEGRSDGPDKAVPEQEGKEYLDIKEVALLIGMPVNTIYKLTASGKMPYTKIGQRLYFKKSKLDRWLEKRARGSQ